MRDFGTGEVKDGVLRLGDTAVPVYNPDNMTKVPDILFYENPQVCTCDRGFLYLPLTLV